MNPYVRQIIAEVAAKHGITPGNIMDVSRYRHIVRARHEVFHRLCNERGYSAERIAAILNRDGSSVRYGIARHAIAEGVSSRLSIRSYTIRLEMSRNYNASHRYEALA